MRKRFMHLILAATLCLLVVAKGFAQENNSKSKDWSFELAPLYLWAVNISGDVTVKGQTQPTSLSFSDIWDNLEGMFTLHFEGLHKSGWGFIVNLDYLDVDATGGSPLGSVNVDMDERILELDLFHRWTDGSHAYDLLIGLRHSDVDIGVDFLNLPLKTDSGDQWTDGIFGARYIYQIAPSWKLKLKGDIGLGGSDLTYQGIGLVTYQAWEHVSFTGGYRALYRDYGSGAGFNRFEYDVTMHGPVIAVNFSW